MTLCPICGWGAQIKPPCTTVMEAVVCDLNTENWRRYVLRYQGNLARGELPTPTLVRSIRGFVPTSPDGPGRGNAFEALVSVTVEEAKDLLEGGAKSAPPQSPG